MTLNAVSNPNDNSKNYRCLFSPERLTTLFVGDGSRWFWGRRRRVGLRPGTGLPTLHAEKEQEDVFSQRALPLRHGRQDEDFWKAKKK